MISGREPVDRDGAAQASATVLPAGSTRHTLVGGRLDTSRVLEPAPYAYVATVMPGWETPGIGREPMTVRVIVAEGNTLTREGLVSVLSGSSLEVVGTAQSLEEALEMVRHFSPDVAFLGASLISCDDLAVLESIKRVSAKTAVVVLSVYDGDCVIEIIQYGATAYLSGNVSRETLLLAASAARQGYLLVDSSALRKALERLVLRPVSQGITPYLTPREREVLVLLTRGLSNGQIAQRLMVSAGTVRTHVSRILRKLDMSDRVQAAVWASAHGLGTPTPDPTPSDASLRKPHPDRP